MKKFLTLIAVAVILIALAYAAGYLPEHERASRLATEKAAAESQQGGLEDQVRFAALHAELLNVIDHVTAMDYGQAQKASSALFDAVRLEAGRTRDAELRSALEQFLAGRDAITSTLAKADPTALDLLRQAERHLRQTLLTASVTVR